MSPEDILIAVVERALAQPRRRPLVLGLCGAQGSGKSTVAAAIARRVPRCVVLSLDDLYLTRAERARLARDVHPLLATRGVPGTHDIALGVATFAALDRGEPVSLPRFDKGCDDRGQSTGWSTTEGPPDLIVFEGWCVGARAQAATALSRPVNALERTRDVDGSWRNHVNAALTGAYQALFARIDLQVLLRAPNWERVLDWRLEQEHALRHSGATGAGVMTDAEVRLFVSHYERLTRHILNEMPGYADLVLQLDDARNCVGVEDHIAPSAVIGS